MADFGSSIKKASDAAKGVETLKHSDGAREVEKLASLITKGKETDKLLDTKEVLTESFTDKTDLERQTREKAKKAPWWKRGLKYVIGGGFGLLLGKEIFGGKKEDVEQAAENTVEVAEESVDIWTDEERLKELNDSIEQGKKTKEEIEEIEREMNEKHGFVPSEKPTKDNWRVYLEEQEKKYADYGHRDAWSDAWEKTRFRYDKETGEKEKRSFVWRLFAFFPAVIGTYKKWKIFEKMKKSRMLDTVKTLDDKKGEAEKKIKEVEGKIEEGMEDKHEAFSAVFEENPYALNLSKQYFQKLGSLLHSADKYSSAERAEQIRSIHRDIGKKGVAKFGPKFGKMKNFEKFLPSMKVKTRGGLVFVEVIGKSLGQALRAGSERGGWATAWDVFQHEMADGDNWKDAAPIWGTIRSFERLGVDDGRSRWSKWLEAGLSLGMDVATVVGIVGSLGVATPGIIAARTAGGGILKSGMRKLAFKQMVRESAKTGEKFATKTFTKQASKTAGRKIVRTAGGKETRNMIMRTAGGKLSFKLHLMMTTISQFFGSEVEETVGEVKHDFRESFYTPEQKRFLELTQNAQFDSTATEEMPTEAVLPEEDEPPSVSAGALKEAEKKQQGKETSPLRVTHKSDDAPREKDESAPTISPWEKEKEIEYNQKNAA
ncbi:MAG: hypothetical protein K9M51_04110 [Candidatus Gracilibacteria bacterium]|nr:hypothetical protein [Candidatus Gracilibacteria bacterium]